MSLTKVSYSMISGTPANALDFGADPTGVSDSSAALTAAFNASNTVYVPPNSTLLLSSNFAVPRSGCTLIGEGYTSEIKFSGNNRRIICSYSNFTMANLLVNGNKPNVGWETANNYDFGLKIGDSVAARISDIRVQNVIFKNIGLDGVYIENAIDVLIDENCQFINCRRWGVAVIDGTYGVSSVKILAKNFDCDYATGPSGKVYPLGAIDFEPYDNAAGVTRSLIDGAFCKSGDIRVVPSSPGTVTNTIVQNCTVVNANIKVFNVNEDVVFQNCNLFGTGVFVSDYTDDTIPTKARFFNINMNTGKTSYLSNSRSNILPHDYVNVADGSASLGGTGSQSNVTSQLIDAVTATLTQCTLGAGSGYSSVDYTSSVNINTDDLVTVAVLVDRIDSNANDVGNAWLRVVCGPIDRRTSLPKGYGQWLLFSVVSDGVYSNPTIKLGTSTAGAITQSVTVQYRKAFVFVNPSRLDIGDLIAYH